MDRLFVVRNDTRHSKKVLRHSKKVLRHAELPPFFRRFAQVRAEHTHTCTLSLFSAVGSPDIAATIAPERPNRFLPPVHHRDRRLLFHLICASFSWTPIRSELVEIVLFEIRHFLPTS